MGKYYQQVSHTCRLSLKLFFHFFSLSRAGSSCPFFYGYFNFPYYYWHYFFVVKESTIRNTVSPEFKVEFQLQTGSVAPQVRMNVGCYNPLRNDQDLVVNLHFTSQFPC